MIVAVLTVLAATGVILAGLGTSQKITSDIFEQNIGSGGLKICHLSDFHYPHNGVTAEKLLEKVSAVSPDYIFLTGDMLDCRAERKDLGALAEIYKKLRDIAPVFGVIGNHEIGSPLLNEYLEKSEECGVYILNNEVKNIIFKGKKISFAGVGDAMPYRKKNLDHAERLQKTVLLLAHRPELFKEYAESDLEKPAAVFAGHAHGGQIRIGNRGLYAPGQGLFPEYTSGQYKFGDSVMYVSRGLGDSYNDFRCFNPYHIIAVTFG